MERNEILKKACEELDYLNCNEETKRLEFLREKAIRDEISFGEDTLEQGYKEGLEKGLKIAKAYLIKK